MTVLDEFRQITIAAWLAASGMIVVLGALKWRLGVHRYAALLARFAARWSRVADKLFIATGSVFTIALIGDLLLMDAVLRPGGRDLAVFDQIIWNSLQGRLFETTFSGGGITSQLGIHFSPLLLALVPVYAITSNPLALKLVQTAGLVRMVFPLFWFAQARIGRFLGFVLAFAFLAAPFLARINRWDFHETPLATTPLALALFFFFRKKYLAGILCLFVVLLIKEDLAFVVGGMGLFLMFVARQVKLGAGVLLRVRKKITSRIS